MKLYIKVIGTHALINAGAVFAATVAYDIFKLASEGRKA